jgi:hypothetical protein
MDRYDEAKDIRVTRSEEDVRSVDRDTRDIEDMSRITDVSRDSELTAADDDGADGPKRQGDILGLGGSVVPKSADDPATEYDEESIARRRARGAGDELAGGSDLPRASGATGIDMGSGGTGTDIE